MKKITKLFVIALILLFTFSGISLAVQPQVVEITKLADDEFNPDNFRPGDINISEAEPVIGLSETIINGISVMGTIVSVISLIIIGIKYLTGSVSEKAEYKKTMLPYLIGIFIFFTITQLLSILFKYVNGFNSQ